MKARIPKHREFIIDFPKEVSQEKADEGWEKLTALLAQSGRPADALEPRFVCPKCQDTGSVNGRLQEGP